MPSLIGRRFPQATIKIVESFYQDDEYTRQMPGRKDYLSVGNQIHVQKRLILSNLKELFAEFKTTYPDIKVCCIPRFNFLTISINF